MIKKVLIKITELYNRWIFRDVKMKEVVLGPEYNKSFVIKYPQNIVIGYKTVLNGNCFINARGGGNYWKILSHRKRFDNIQSQS